MALILHGPLIADIRGSTGGQTFSRCAGGSYVRNRTKPVNPRASGQEVARARLTVAANRWNTTLTQQQRDDWKAYADATNWTNKLGQSIVIPAIAAFARYFAIMRLMNQGDPAAAPTMPGHAANPEWTVTAQPTAGTITVTKPGPPFEDDNDAHFMAYWMGLPMPAGRLHAPRGVRFLGYTTGAAVPPSFPLAFPTLYTMAVGQRVTVFGLFIDEYKRLGSRLMKQALAANP